MLTAIILGLNPLIILWSTVSILLFLAGEDWERKLEARGMATPDSERRRTLQRARPLTGDRAL